MTQRKNETKVPQSQWARLRYMLAQLRIKITVPYVLLALIVTFAAAFIVTRLLASLLEDRFHAALTDAGRKAADSLAALEEEQLAAWRNLAFSEGFDKAVVTGDRAALEQIAVPVAVNHQLDALEVLNRDGASLFAMYHIPGGSVADYDATPGTGRDAWPTVQAVLQKQTDPLGDKYAAFIETERGWIFYTLGPIHHEGQVVGALLVGTYLDHLVARLDAAALARVSIYLNAGPPQASTLAPTTPALLALDADTFHEYLERQTYQSPRRDIQVGGRSYAEVFGGLKVRLIQNAGLFSVALPLSFVTDSGSATRESMLSLFGVFIIVVMIVGMIIANAVVRRVQRLATATRQVAGGDLTFRLTSKGLMRSPRSPTISTKWSTSCARDASIGICSV